MVKGSPTTTSMSDGRPMASQDQRLSVQRAINSMRARDTPEQAAAAEEHKYDQRGAESTVP